MSKAKILVVDDDEEIRELIRRYLEKENMDVSLCENGEKALKLVFKENFDLVILDIMMEGLDGFEVIKKIREKNQHIHIIFLSAKSEDYDKILGLGLGADDFITKPFVPGELIARVKSQLRRNALLKNKKEFLDKIKKGEFEIDLTSYTAKKNGILLELSAKEFKLLYFFIENPNRVFTKKQIYENVWDDDYFDDNTLMVYIRHLREKIEDDPDNPKFIINVRGIGYKFVLEGNE